MKKIFSLFLIFQFFWIMAFPVYSATIPTNVKIITENNKYGLIDKQTKKTLIPTTYDSMKKASDEAVQVTLKGKSGILFNNNEIAVPIEYNSITIEKIKYKGKKYWNYYGIDNNTGLIFSKVTTDAPHKKYSKNNEIIATRNHKLKDEVKYGFIKELGNDKYLTIPALYDDYYFPDHTRNNTIISFPNYLIVKKNNKWGVIDHKGKTIINFSYDKIMTFDSYIKEQNAKNTVVEFPVNDKFIGFKGNNIYIINSKGKVLYSEKKPNISYLINNKKSKNLLTDIYEYNNKTSVIKFNNFPNKGIIPYEQNKKYGMIVIDENGYKKIPAQYQRLRFPDENSVIFNILGISYAPLNQVWILETSTTDRKSGYYKTTNDKARISPHAYKLSVPDERVLKETNEKFDSYYKDAVIVKNNVIFYQTAVYINNELTKPSDIQYTHDNIRNREIFYKFDQEKSIGDVAVNVSDKNSPNPKVTTFPSYTYRQTGWQKTGDTIKTIVLFPFQVIAFPFVCLFFVIFDHN